MPFEYGGNLPFEEQISISTEGLEKVMALLDRYQVKATFYTTGRYAQARPDLIRQLHAGGHEIASHTFNHSVFEEQDLLKSRNILEEITGAPVTGFRMPRMMPVRNEALEAAGYQYNSSINPTWIPGRYNHLKAPRTLYRENQLWQLPASVTPSLRLPLFWLSFHNFPFAFYWQCCRQTMQADGYLNLYYHPWEFVNYRLAGGARFPPYVTTRCGDPLLKRLELLIQWSLKKGYVFDTTIHWLNGQTRQDVAGSLHNL